MNHSDSERIAAYFEKNNLSETSNINEANFVVFNTCGVRQMAEDRVYGQIHNIRKKKQKTKIILTGCLANRKDVQKRLKDKVDLFFPINEFEKLENFVIENLLEIGNWKLEIAQKNKLPNKENISYLSIKPKHANAYQAFVPIMTGCNNFCAYCVVPYARGREVSRPHQEIIKEIKALVKNGYQEITLLGQNVNSYSDGKVNFSKLLKKVDAIPGNFRIFFISNHPKDVDDEMIESVTFCKKVCECFHLPLQAGSDEVLRKMNRKYTAKDYLKIVNKIKKSFEKNKPGKLFAITTDIIVGFPGETKKQFEESAKLMRKAKYDMVYFGQFSPRTGTAAWKMKDNVSKAEKARREKYLNEILKKTTFENNKNYVGKILEVLIEKEENGFYYGKTRTMKNVKILATEKNLVGKILNVKIIKANAWNLEGKLN